MNYLFGDDLMERPRRELAPGAVHVPNWLNMEQQKWLVARFKEWASGPVPIRSAKVGGHEMSVKTVCLGWHWRPYQYTRDAVDVNGNRVLDFPDWMVRLGRKALVEASGNPHAGDDFTPDTALVNYYDATAQMGMHQDKDELSKAPVVSLSIGDTCQFRFGNADNRSKPYEDISLSSGDLFVFGGASRFAYHGVPRIYPGTAPDGCGLATGRINITMRVTGMGEQ
ncbi:alpha-ketoglutarate-dependent dioxygenase AlkB family protein [Arthrobacter sp. A2-55]|uniref:alpha-ketoglutarate-dependent dioxygenase AlkB family protein n=1 Tax=Arthrobacter sp. A2-55 TaxID=2897337 RepID=UPI0021CD2E44|nr:alpha-ketoglutarate-dependent dioxygenase AlkB [Arthrobacter sp. A2-55]MCU6480760.1 alpha-ketoglutarate-dependent dioxygenase AlkB [Arthrobacter sp. A2-55]